MVQWVIMIVKDVIQWFEAWANPQWQEKWDNSGWQVEPGVLQIPAHVLVALTPTLSVMEEAIAYGNQGIPVNLILTHHPLIFNPLKSLRHGEAVAQIIRLAFLHNIGIYTAHTNFDQVDGGTAAVLADLLHLKQVIPLVPTGEGRGYGRIGILDPVLPLQALLTHICQVLSPPDLIVSPVADTTELIQKVAVLGGSGASFMDAALSAGAEVYVTADCKFHQFQASRDGNLILVDAGHYGTERPACERLVERLKELGLPWVKLSVGDEDFRQFFHS